MTVRELRRLLARIPDDALVCKTSGENCCLNMQEVRYYPHWNLLYIEPSWERETKGLPDHLVLANTDGDNDTKRLKLDKFMLTDVCKLAERGKAIVDAKEDGKKHRVQIILSKWDEYLFGSKLRSHKWLSLVVDDMREAGGKLGVGTQTVLCDFEWESFKRESGDA